MFMSNTLHSPNPNALESGQLRSVSPSPSWLGGCARRAQPLQRVTRAPLFLHLALGYAMNEDGRYLDLLASGLHAHSLSSIMGATPREAGHDLVAFGDLVLDGDVEVREGVKVLGEVPLVALAVGFLVGKQIVINEVGSQHFVYKIQVTLLDFLDQTAGQSLVLFRHASPPFSSSHTIHMNDATPRSLVHPRRLLTELAESMFGKARLENT